MLNKKTVLLIDDDIDDQEIFSLALSRADQSAECICSNDAIQALEKIDSDSNFKPDYIFVDMNMPRMNGTQCLAEIKKIERLKNVPVFIYSTSSDPNSIIENKNLGAEDFIVKPADINILTRLLSRILKSNPVAIFSLLILLAAFPSKSFSQKQQPDSTRKVSDLKRLSVEELMNIVVTSVSKTPENLSEVASAIQVVTGEEIKRSTATSLPEALRLANNMQVAQAGSHDWGITARGFNGLPVSGSSLANKLLVMIDGRSVYTPLFGGVFWDVQNVLMKDIDRLEIISGPGGTVWGANAVNGVVNIISKSARETQGVYAAAEAGSFLKNAAAVRYGSHKDSTLFFRVYGQHFDYNNTKLLNNADARDSWYMNQGGFRLDYLPSAQNTITVQGDAYVGKEDDTASTDLDGQNVIFKWNHALSGKSNFIFQYYFDRSYRNIRIAGAKDKLVTNDFEFQHNFSIGSKNKFIWGADYRLADDVINTVNHDYDPSHKLLTLFSVFAQDQYSIIPKKLELTMGTKILHNNYTDIEFHPTVRLSYSPDPVNTIWAGVSQAVRTPTRFDVDNKSSILGSYGDFKSEKVIAYEAGYHSRPFKMLTFSLATFYNDYRDLRSIDTNTTPPPFYYYANHLKAQTYGFEFSVNADITGWWKIRGGFSYLHEDFTLTDPHTYPFTYRFEAIDPESWFNLQSMIDIGQHFQFDVLVRYSNSLPEAISIPAVDSYFNAGARLGYHYKWMTLSISGQNLLQENHIESGSRQIPRSILGKLEVSF